MTEPSRSSLVESPTAPSTASLAVTCHDPSGRFAAGVAAAAGVLAEVFDRLAVNATAETAPATMAAIEGAHSRVLVSRHAAGSIGIGEARRDALALALPGAADRIMYADLDHVLRWAAADPDELFRVATTVRSADLVVVGRSPTAWAAEPERLRTTEGLVNRVASLALDHDDVWDLMIAVRLLGPRATRLIVSECVEDSIANDVVWPLLVRSRGLDVAYVAVDGLAFREREDFGSPHDTRDDDLAEWARRTRTAALHVDAVADFVSRVSRP